MLKVGVLGVGGISGAHIPAWNRIEQAKLVALCDIRPEQLEPYKDGSYHLYTDFEDMIANEDLDIIDICLPTFLHVEYSIKAMQKGINVLCEKPISLNSEDVKKVYAAAKQHNVKFMVAHVIRFWDEYVFLKDIIDTKKYGKLKNGHIERMGNTPKWSWDDWMADPQRSGLVPFDLHIHDLDWLIYTLGKPTSISVNRVKSGKSDYMNGLYNYDGFFITAHSAWFDNEFNFTYGYRFMFEDAVIELKSGTLTVFETSGKTYTVGGDISSDDACINLPATDAYFNEIRYFTDCVLYNKPADIINPDELECVLNILNEY